MGLFWELTRMQVDKYREQLRAGRIICLRDAYTLGPWAPGMIVLAPAFSPDAIRVIGALPEAEVGRTVCLSTDAPGDAVAIGLLGTDTRKPWLRGLADELLGCPGIAVNDDEERKLMQDLVELVRLMRGARLSDIPYLAARKEVYDALVQVASAEGQQVPDPASEEARGRLAERLRDPLGMSPNVHMLYAIDSGPSLTDALDAGKAVIVLMSGQYCNGQEIPSAAWEQLVLFACAWLARVRCLDEHIVHVEREQILGHDLSMLDRIRSNARDAGMLLRAEETESGLKRRTAVLEAGDVDEIVSLFRQS